MIDKCGLEGFITEHCGLIEEFDFVSGEKYFMKFRLKADQNEEQERYAKFIDEFILTFSNFTKTNWIVRKSYPSLKRFLFRKDYTCQHSSFNKKSDKSSRGRNCTAKIKFIIKKVNKDTIRNDKLLSEGYNVLVTIAFEHSHRVYVAEALNLLKCSKETEERFKQYFNNGMTPCAAINYNELNILDSFQDTAVNGIEMLSNSQINPSENHVYYMYNKWRTEKYGNRDECNLPEIMEGKIETLNNKGYTVLFKQNPRIIVIITPIMKRVFLSTAYENMIFVDTTSSCDQTSSAITLVFTSHKIGGLPLACAIHTEQNESNYTLVFAAIKEALEKNDMNKKFVPDIVMTDDSTAERNALRTIFPNARLLLCAFHVCQAFWRWLCVIDHKVDIMRRQSIMIRFRNILFETDPEEAGKMYEELTSDEYVKTMPALINHMSKLWHRRLEWCISDRLDLLTRGNNTNNITEASIRILKDVILQRCKAFNACALVDFITSIFENYFQRRIISYANTRKTKDSIYAMFMKSARNIKNISKVNDNEYSVESETHLNTFYTVRADLAVCDCDAGKSGRFCKHICSIEQKFGVIFPNSPRLSIQDRISLARIATGDEINENFYVNMLSLDEIPNNDLDSITQGYSSNTQGPTQDTVNSSTYPQEVAVEFPKQYENAVVEFKTEIKRFTSLFETNPTVHNLRALSKFTNMIKKVNTSEQAQNLILHQIMTRRVPRKIKVQSTSISRRKERGIGKSKSRVQAGRPSNKERITKRKHDLGQNIKMNVNNAR